MYAELCGNALAPTTNTFGTSHDCRYLFTALLPGDEPMLGVALYSGFVVLREIDAVQVDAGGLPSRLPEGDARRVRFDALHVLSTRLMMFNIAGALVLLYWEARE